MLFRSGGATLGGNGTLDTHLVMEAASIFDIQSNGAKYTDKFAVNGGIDASAGGFTLKLVGDFSDVHVSDGNGGMQGNSLFNDVYMSNLFTSGTFTMNPAAQYTLDIYNIGGSGNITDWSLAMNSSPGVGFLIFQANNSSGFNDNWNLSAAMIADGWSLKWMDDAVGKHQLWLFYANPTRVPEPSTYALLLGTLSLAVVVIRRRFTR